MKKLLVIAIATCFFAVNSNAQVKRNVDPSQKTQSDSTHKNRNGKMMKDLNLTPDQKSKMKEIHQSTQQQKDAIKNDAGLTQEQKVQKFKELRSSQQEKMNSILTQDQKVKMKAMKQHRKSDSKMKGKKRMAAPNHGQSTHATQKNTTQ